MLIITTDKHRPTCLIRQSELWPTAIIIICRGQNMNMFFFSGGKVFHPILGIPWSRLIASWMFKGSSARTPSSTSSFMTWFIPIFQHQIKGNVAGKPVVLLCFCWMVFCRSSKPFSTFLFGGYIGRFHQQRWAKTRRRNEWTTGLIFTMDGNAWSDGHVTINKWR